MLVWELLHVGVEACGGGVAVVVVDGGGCGDVVLLSGCEHVAERFFLFFTLSLLFFAYPYEHGVNVFDKVGVVS